MSVQFFPPHDRCKRMKTALQLILSNTFMNLA